MIRGLARLGAVGCGRVRPGGARSGSVWPGGLWHDKGNTLSLEILTAFIGAVRITRHGMARLGMAWRREVWRGLFWLESGRVRHDREPLSFERGVISYGGSKGSRRMKPTVTATRSGRGRVVQGWCREKVKKRRFEGG